MAEIIDLDETQEETQETEQLDTQDSTQQAEPTEQTQETKQESTEDDIPEKYRGKSPEELIRMHQEAERLIGKQGAEVGDLRKVVDEYIQSNLEAKPNKEPTSEETVEEVDYYTDPEKAISKAIENHPAIKEAKETTQEQRKAATFSKLKTKFPDLEETIQDPKFAEWIQGSPLRTRLFVEADQNYDFDAANDLFSEWQERKKMVQQSVEQETQASKDSVKKASTGDARPSSDGSGSRKIYRRADIIKLMQTDPDRYESLQPELMQAYAEGRVK